jgi:site-specific recombinase XerD
MLSKFLSTYLSGQRNYSKNTVLSYRDTFKIFLAYLKDEKGIAAEKITLNSFSSDIIIEFIVSLKEKRKSSVSTCNQRLGAIHAFFDFVQGEMPEMLAICQEVIHVKMMKAPQAAINYLSLDGIQALLSMPDTRFKSGRRDAMMLSLMYDTGARVQEIVDMTVGDVRFISPATVRLYGKGSKARIVPLLKQTEELLQIYMKDLPLRPTQESTAPLFLNRSNEPFTRSGVTYILKKYADEARSAYPGLIPTKISPHCLRHSKAMHLLQGDVNLIYIRDLLGHTKVKTTEIYAKADSAAKRRAIEKGSLLKNPVQFPSWSEDEGLTQWLQDFGK